MFGGGAVHEDWKVLQSVEQLDELVNDSNGQAVVLFKHSTRCSISTTARDRLTRGWEQLNDKATFYYLDLIAHRDISNTIASRFGVRHESPQVIVFKNGNPIYNASHFGVNVEGLLGAIEKA